LIVKGDHTVNLPPLVPGWVAPGKPIVLSPAALFAINQRLQQEGKISPYESTEHFMYWHLIRLALCRPR
jgi:hypothetical protein